MTLAGFTSSISRTVAPTRSIGHGGTSSHFYK